MTIISAAVLLFLAMDPLGNITLFLTELKKVCTERMQKVIIRELLAALLILIFFLLVGRFFMKIIHITQPALTVAGGVILFLTAIRMIFPDKQNSMQVDLARISHKKIY